MIKLPKISNCEVCGYSLSKGIVRHVKYEINKEYSRTDLIDYCKTTKLDSINIDLPKLSRPQKSDEIVEESDHFINDFKVVRTENGEYGYIRESDNTLLPYRYDIAFDFNKYGLAIVGKDGRVSWIDNNFRYLNRNGIMVEDDNTNFNGFRSVSRFSKGNIPLSRIKMCSGSIAYFGLDGKYKEFYRYNGDLNIEESISTFSSGTIFDEDGYALADDVRLFAQGFYVNNQDLIKIALEKEILDYISEDAEECFDNEVGRALVKKNNQGR